MKIVNAIIVKKGKGHGNRTLNVEYEDGTREQGVISWYSDEHVFVPSEFIELTREQAIDHFHRRDVAWLQSPDPAPSREEEYKPLEDVLAEWERVCNEPPIGEITIELDDLDF